MKKILFLLTFILTSCVSNQSISASGSYTAKVYYHYKTIQPYLCITFDDGPDKVQTIKVLDTLKRYKATATFFVLGEEVEYQKDILKKVYDAGHEIGNHFYTHININKASEEQIRESIVKNNQLIYQTIGVTPRVVRPPYGIVNDKLKKVCSELQMDIIIWTDDKDSRDWDKTATSTIVNKLTKKVTNGDIFLFHDGDKSYTNTISSIDIIIPDLEKKGFEWVSISTLIDN